MWVSKERWDNLLILIGSRFDELTFEEPARWALLLEKYFAIRKDEEGLMLAQAISKKLAKKRTRIKKEKVSDEPTGV